MSCTSTVCTMCSKIMRVANDSLQKSATGRCKQLDLYEFRRKQFLKTPIVYPFCRVACRINPPNNSVEGRGRGTGDAAADSQLGLNTYYIYF